MPLHPEIERQLPDAIRRLRVAADMGGIEHEVAAILIAAFEPSEARRAERDRWLLCAFQALNTKITPASRAIAKQLRAFQASPAECRRAIVTGTAFASSVANAFLAEPRTLSPKQISRVLTLGGTFPAAMSHRPR